MQNGSSVHLHVHVNRGQLLWYVVVQEPGKAKYVLSRGPCERPPDPVDDTYGRFLMDAAYEAYRASGA